MSFLEKRLVKSQPLTAMRRRRGVVIGQRTTIKL
jgi:hypothetical protein